MERLIYNRLLNEATRNKGIRIDDSLLYSDPKDLIHYPDDIIKILPIEYQREINEYRGRLTKIHTISEEAEVSESKGTPSIGSPPKVLLNKQLTHQQALDRINEKTGEYYKTCELIITYCLWCGRNAQGQDYCDTRCAIAEKRYDDAADDYY